MDFDILKQASELEQRGHAFALATVVWRQGPSSSQQGARAIITAGGEVHGWIGGACAEPVVNPRGPAGDRRRHPAPAAARQPGPVRRGDPRRITVVPISCQSEGALEVYVEPVVPAPHLVIVGARRWRTRWPASPGHCAGVPSLSRPRTSPRPPPPASRWSVVATQGHGDEEAVEQAVRRPARLTWAWSGPAAAAPPCSAISPTGPARRPARPGTRAGRADLGHTTHEEDRRSRYWPSCPVARFESPGRGRPEPPRQHHHGPRQRPGTTPAPGAPAATTPAPAQAVDPVCGMTVQATPASYCWPTTAWPTTLLHELPRRFEQDPAAYATRETRC